ncbi:MAG: type III-A CRISPR-associated protein Csm2 [Desulfobacterota bacterium]|nr:type III-A CRISPR-associated protein Csm2 [Thermodesulfobacteriota bacterium]
MDKEKIKKWIQEGLTPESIKEAERFGKDIKEKDLTTSQIRQVFTKLKSIEAKGYRENKIEFLMLKPLLAYSAGRHKKEGLKEFKDKITLAIDAVVEGAEDEQENRFKNFCKFFEAILAYHRSFGGN